jgi:hypothetical protein
MEGARFGTALALYLGTAVVGAPLETGPAAQTGAAYVLTRSGSSWTQIAKLVADAAVANDQFGFSVAANGVTAAAGAPGRDQQGADSGVAYAFGLF